MAEYQTSVWATDFGIRFLLASVRLLLLNVFWELGADAEDLL